MTTQWQITAAAERAELDPTGQAEIAFTVTNPGPVDDRATLDAVPGNPAERGWYAIAEPQRQVPHGGSVQVIIKIAVPPQSPPGPHEVQLRVYSADAAPEESSAVSSRVTFDVPQPEQPKPKPWWLLAVAALVVVTLVVVGILVFGSDEVAVPNVVTLPKAAAVEKVVAAGLQVEGISTRQDPSRAGLIVDQSVPADSMVPEGSNIKLVAGVNLTAPGNLRPTGAVSRTDPVTFSWTQVPDASLYRITVESEFCGGVAGCRFSETFTQTLSDSSVTTKTPLPSRSTCGGDIKIQLCPFGGPTGQVRWRVAALADQGDPGPASPFVALLVK
jgi:hypothetical protein